MGVENINIDGIPEVYVMLQPKHLLVIILIVTISVVPLQPPQGDHYNASYQRNSIITITVSKQTYPTVYSLYSENPSGQQKGPGLLKSQLYNPCGSVALLL